ncbi:hypothetical protein [Candidatus Villigracilis saccharophilus]|uniref:hypothetical protein n=1 Tax=Candidatus Villigracilis saccharophilus TaxID=3140684 RepID=UPI003135B833|nr:hypothetical protein [Anaerolineales bacterium]
MNTPTLEDQLVSELWARDVRFLMGRQFSATPLLAPANLIAGLAQSANARVRFSLIPFFLRHPEFSAEVENADKSLSSQINQYVLRFYYTAAVYLQRKYQERLIRILGKQPQLPDLFSSKLGVLPETNPDQALAELARRHKILSGQFVNWLGTYEHAAEVWLKQMELQKA